MAPKGYGCLFNFLKNGWRGMKLEKMTLAMNVLDTFSILSFRVALVFLYQYFGSDYKMSKHLRL